MFALIGKTYTYSACIHLLFAIARSLPGKTHTYSTCIHLLLAIVTSLPWQNLHVFSVDSFLTRYSYKFALAKPTHIQQAFISYSTLSHLAT